MQRQTCTTSRLLPSNTYLLVELPNFAAHFSSPAATEPITRATSGGTSGRVGGASSRGGSAGLP
jgi:hypothetical protein